MDRKIALSEVQAMRGKPVSEYAKYAPSVKVSLSETLPDTLESSHEKLTEVRVALAEQQLHQAKLIVKQAIDTDDHKVLGLVKSGKITPAVANKLIALCERKRANQLVFLAEGDPEMAAGEDGDIQDFVGALGDMPDNIATEAPTAGAAAGADAGQENPVADEGSAEEELTELAAQIAQQEGIPYEQALVKAEQMLAQKNGGAV